MFRPYARVEYIEKLDPPSSRCPLLYNDGTVSSRKLEWVYAKALRLSLHADLEEYRIFSKLSQVLLMSSTDRNGRDSCGSVI